LILKNGQRILGRKILNDSYAVLRVYGMKCGIANAGPVVCFGNIKFMKNAEYGQFYANASFKLKEEIEVEIGGQCKMIPIYPVSRETIIFMSLNKAKTKKLKASQAVNVQ
jgi:hypothetical protein